MMSPSNGEEHSLSVSLLPLFDHGSSRTEKIDQHVVAEVRWIGIEDSPAVDRGEMFNKTPKLVVRVKHEGVDHDIGASTASHLCKCRSDRLWRRWVGKEDLAGRKNMGRRFPIRYEQDLLRAVSTR